MVEFPYYKYFSEEGEDSMKTKIFLKMAVIVFLTIFAVSCGKSDKKESVKNKKYIIAVDLIYPPFSYKENDQNVGIDVDLMKAIAKQEGFEVEIKPMDFGGIIPAIQSGQLDGAIAGANITEERKKIVDFSEPYYDAGLVAVVNKDNTTIKTSKDLEGKNIAVKNGTAGAKYANQNLKNKAQIRVYEDTASMLKAVENNQADAAFEDYPVIAYTLKVTPGAKLKIGTDKLTNDKNGFMVKKGENKELLEKFNKGLKTLKENGEYQKIIDKYTK